MCEEAFRDAEADEPDGKQMERPSWCWVRPWPAAGVFSSSFFLDQNCDRALKIVHTTTSKQGSPALTLAQGGTGARITAYPGRGEGGGVQSGQL